MAGPESAPSRPEPGGTSSEWEPRTLAKRGIPAFVAIAVLILIAWIAPGLGEVRELLPDAAPGWVAIAVAFEALSFASYIVMFAPVFCRGLSWRRSWQIGGSELAVGSLIPASGASPWWTPTMRFLARSESRSVSHRTITSTLRHQTSSRLRSASVRALSKRSHQGCCRRSASSSDCSWRFSWHRHGVISIARVVPSTRKPAR